MKMFFMLIGICAVIAECKAQEPTAEVQVEVIDSVGQEISWAKSVLLDKGTDDQYEFVGGLARVPLGHYVLRIEANGFASQLHQLRVLQSKVYVRVALEISDVGAGHANRVSGTISGDLPKNQDIWLRLVPLVRKNYSDIDHKISGSRTYDLLGVPTGEYLLLVLGGCPNSRNYPTVLSQRALSVFGRTTANLTLVGNEVTTPCADSRGIK